jgi:hypothetical protein
MFSAILSYLIKGGNRIPEIFLELFPTQATPQLLLASCKKCLIHRVRIAHFGPFAAQICFEIHPFDLSNRQVLADLCNVPPKV